MPNYKNSVLGANFTIDEDTDVEIDGPGEEQAEALAVTQIIGESAHINQGVEWTYGATAEDNGIAGELDLQPGIVFSGPAGLYTVCKVAVNQVDVLEGAIIAPEQEDFVTLGLYVNSALWAIAGSMP